MDSKSLNLPSIEIYLFIEKGAIQRVRLEDSQVGFKYHLITDQFSPKLDQHVEEWLQGYAKGKPPKVLWPFAMPSMPSFTLKVWSAIQAIPFGSTLSYAAIAQKIGHPQAYRAVGGACGRNPFPLLIPCHRVLAVNQMIGGFTGGIEIKKKLLAFENHIVDDLLESVSSSLEYV